MEFGRSLRGGVEETARSLTLVLGRNAMEFERSLGRVREEFGWSLRGA